MNAWCKSKIRCARVLKAFLHGVGNTNYQSDHMLLLLDTDKDQNIVVFLKLYNDMQNHLGVDRTVKTFQDV